MGIHSPNIHIFAILHAIEHSAERGTHKSAMSGKAECPFKGLSCGNSFIVNGNSFIVNGDQQITAIQTAKAVEYRVAAAAQPTLTTVFLALFGEVGMCDTKLLSRLVYAGSSSTAWTSSQSPAAC